jgi:hypothetical protein
MRQADPRPELLCRARKPRLKPRGVNTVRLIDQPARGGAACASTAAGGGLDDTETSMLRLPEAPAAFKDLMTRVLQFALRIAFRCVLHRRESLDIHC